MTPEERAVMRLRRNLEEQSAFPPVDVLIVQRSDVVALLGQLDQYAAVVQRARRLLQQHDEPCRFDHHGWCQAHACESPCAVAELQAALDAAAPHRQGR